MAVEPAGARVGLVRLRQEEALGVSRRPRLLVGRRHRDSAGLPRRPPRPKVVLVAQARLASLCRVGSGVRVLRRRLLGGEVGEGARGLVALVGVSLARPRRRLPLVQPRLGGLVAAREVLVVEEVWEGRVRRREGCLVALERREQRVVVGLVRKRVRVLVVEEALVHRRWEGEGLGSRRCRDNSSRERWVGLVLRLHLVVEGRLALGGVRLLGPPRGSSSSSSSRARGLVGWWGVRRRVRGAPRGEWGGLGGG